jgi:hypothetical protein
MKIAVRLILLLLLIGGAWFGWRWLERHPQHNPYAPFSLAHPIGWATSDKLTALVETPFACRSILTEGGVRFTTQPAIGTGECRLNDRTRLDALSMTLRPDQPNSTCAAAAGLIL